MGPLEPRLQDCSPHEVGIFGEVVAPSQQIASAIANNLRVGCLHNSCKCTARRTECLLLDPGQLATAGNFAIPLTPHEQPAGPVFRFSVYHLIPLPNPSDWPIGVFRVGVPQGSQQPVDPEFHPHVPKAIVKPKVAKPNGHVTSATSKLLTRLVLKCRPQLFARTG